MSLRVPSGCGGMLRCPSVVVFFAPDQLDLADAILDGPRPVASLWRRTLLPVSASTDGRRPEGVTWMTGTFLAAWGKDVPRADVGVEATAFDDVLNDLDVRSPYEGTKDQLGVMGATLDKPWPVASFWRRTLLPVSTS